MTYRGQNKLVFFPYVKKTEFFIYIKDIRTFDYCSRLIFNAITKRFVSKVDIFTSFAVKSHSARRADDLRENRRKGGMTHELLYF